jgi:hypothetical protein
MLYYEVIESYSYYISGLNPIEEPFHQWKSHMKTLPAMDESILIHEIAKNVHNVWPKSIANQFSDMQKNIYPLALAKKDIVTELRKRKRS